MAQNEKIIEGLQIIVTDLAQQADGHAIQSRIFASEGFLSWRINTRSMRRKSAVM